MCNQCEVLNINGVNCHERGCPDATVIPERKDQRIRTRRTIMDIIINYDGSITVSTMHKGYRQHRQYFGYTKREAIKLFRQHIKELNN